MRKCRVISGKGFGSIGICRENKNGTVTFYPRHGVNPYCMTLNRSQVEFIERKHNSYVFSEIFKN
jgi:hypothetical protein